MRDCKRCGSPIPETRNKGAHYCSLKCRQKLERDLYRKNNPFNGIPKGSVGTISELVVCSDLLRRGYEVFRSVSPHCSCDIAILKNKELIRVEVKTGSIKKNGSVQTPPGVKSELHDILAIVLRNGTIEYRPPFPSETTNTVSLVSGLDRIPTP